MSGNISIQDGLPIREDTAAFNVEQVVRARYERGARAAQPELCCPVKYDAKYLEILPQEIIDKDYGCGDPSAHVHEGERVLDLGSGGGKICYILSQKVGAAGSVVGVDFNDEMLSLARKYLPYMEEKLGYGNVEFKKGRIQDLALDLTRVQKQLDDSPVGTVEDLQNFEAECHRLRTESPMIPTASIDVIVSNCVLNLVRTEEKAMLFEDMHRVLRRGGRAVISDIVCDESPPPAILNDPELWGGCIAGAFREDHFLEMFEQAGFYGIEIVSRQEEPWRVIDGIEFRSLTVRAYKGKEGVCMERHQGVTYRGPWKSVTDDDGHTLKRGELIAICDKTFDIFTREDGPYAKDIIAHEPVDDVSAAGPTPWNNARSTLRHPRELKGTDYDLTTDEPGAESCGPACC